MGKGSMSPERIARQKERKARAKANGRSYVEQLRLENEFMENSLKQDKPTPKKRKPRDCNYDAMNVAVSAGRFSPR